MRRRAFVRPLVTGSAALAAGFACFAATVVETAAQTGPAAAPAQPETVLALSMDGAVAMALETNLGLARERLDVDIAAMAVVSARAAFLPTLTTSLSRVHQQSLAQRFSDGTTSVSERTSISSSTQASQLLPWTGGSYAVTWSASRDETPGGSSTFNPSLGSALRINVSQPLWRNLIIDGPRASLRRSERVRRIADIELEQRIVATEANVRGAYLGLIAAVEGRKVAQRNMDLAMQSLQNARARVEVGQSAPIDIVTNEVSVESNREQLIVAEARVATAEDELRLQILDPARPDYWQVRIEPTDPIQLTPRPVDADAIIRSALANRLDLAALKRSVEITDLNLSLSRTQTRPSVNLNFDYAASGAGGTANDEALSRRFASVIGDTFGGTYPTWALGVSVGYPVGRSAAHAALAQSELQKRQQLLDIRQLELAIVTDARRAVRDVQTSYQRVQATQAARAASERQLDAEERKFEVGMADTFQLQTRQNQLAAARVSELNAVVSYNAALIELERIQKIR